MKTLILALLLVPWPSFGQEMTISGKLGGKSGWILKLDPAAFTWIANPDGSLTLKVPPGSNSPKKIIGDVRFRGADGTYSIPTGAKNLEVWVNGLHYWEGTDFDSVGSILVPKTGAGNWPVDAVVRINYEI